jgi:regulator of protease activity HflC (stomatin/prohibitin superfamily)
LERLESLETTELLDATGDTTLFEGADGVGVGARRLRMLYRWLLPILSLLFASGLVLAGWMVASYLNATSDSNSVAVFEVSQHRGWLIAIDVSFAVIAFIFSRYLAGMAQIPAWKNLRAAAGIMIGNAVVFVAVAVGVVFRFFELPAIIEGVAWGISILMFAVAIEIVFALVMNIYRPRISGEYPRAAFDSRGLSMLSRPDSFIQSINEAVNYQFGFDITSSWGYQLVLRSGLWLGGLGILSLLVMSMFVVVDGREEGLRLRAGRIIESDGHLVQQPGAFWKLPWPIEYASLHDATEVRAVPVTPAEAAIEDGASVRYDSWASPRELMNKTGDAEFIVRPSILGEAAMQSLIGKTDVAGDSLVSDGRWAMIRARITLSWRVKSGVDGKESELLRFLSFGTDRVARRQTLTDRERMLRVVVSAEATSYFATLGLDEVLTSQRGELGLKLRGRVQKALDELESGIEVVVINLPMVSPPEDAVQSFEDLPVAIQQADRTIAQAEREQSNMLTSAVGDLEFVDEVAAAVERVDLAKVSLANADPSQAAAASVLLDDAVKEAERLIRRGGGAAYQIIANAERDRWVGLLARKGQAGRVLGQQAAWTAAPDLYRQRAVMRLYSKYLPGVRKYVMGIDPSRLDLNIELRELASPNTVFSESLLEEGEE